MTIQVFFTKSADNPATPVGLPIKTTAGAAAYDLAACLDAPIILQPNDFKLIPTGWRIALPEGYEAQVRSRSGLAAKHGVFVLNSPGTIDADYRGEIFVILKNAGSSPFVIEHGMRIGQMLVQAVVPSVVVELSANDFAALDNTTRGSQGFGSTGV
jgi:dUTP pyrophosphatase